MPELVPPTLAVHESYLAALVEYKEFDGSEEVNAEALAEPLAFLAYVERVRAGALPETSRPDGWVPATTLWWVEGDVFLGHLSIRHWLTPELRRVGGHIGYDVRPSERRKGHATAMLHAALPVAAGLGINPALVTCDPTNVASRRVIERAGGQLAVADDTKLRVWVATTSPGPGGSGQPARGGEHLSG